MKRILISALIALNLLTGCSQAEVPATPPEINTTIVQENAQGKAEVAEQVDDTEYVEATIGTHEIDGIPEYSGEPHVSLGVTEPNFEVITTDSFEFYSDLDELGRNQFALACIGQDIMPDEDRESISNVYPAGWNQNPYDFVDGGWLYNRCHLIGFQLTGENANELNLMTGTRYFNVDGMLPFENMVADYVKETNNHVMYRVTPIYEGNELVARGVQIEAYSVEDYGSGIHFNVFCYNVQPNVIIDYMDGSNYAITDAVEEPISESKEEVVASDDYIYVLNLNSMKIHYPDCSSVEAMSEKNKEFSSFSKEELFELGYEFCGNCG